MNIARERVRPDGASRTPHMRLRELALPSRDPDIDNWPCDHRADRPTTQKIKPNRAPSLLTLSPTQTTYGPTVNAGRSRLDTGIATTLPLLTNLG